jgi:hypothetical protein
MTKPTADGHGRVRHEWCPLEREALADSCAAMRSSNEKQGPPPPRDADRPRARARHSVAYGRSATHQETESLKIHELGTPWP